MVIQNSNKKTPIATYKKNSTGTVLFFPNKEKEKILRSVSLPSLIGSFPTPPSIDLPRWCYDGGTYTEPPLTNREVGWAAVPGQNYAQPPPYQWVNWLSYSTGEWINYIAAYAIPYLQNGNFDNGINIFNNNSAKFYNASNDKYVSLKNSTAQTVASVPLVLPPALPTTQLPMVCDTSGNLTFSTISSPAVTGITSGSAPLAGQVGEYFLSNGSVSVNDSSSNVVMVNATFASGIWVFSGQTFVSLSPPSTIFSLSSLAIGFNNSAVIPSPAINGYNFTQVSGLDSIYQCSLSNYVINSSTTFTLFFVCSFSYYTTIITSVWYSFLARRIA